MIKIHIINIVSYVACHVKKCYNMNKSLYKKTQKFLRNSAAYA